MTTAILNGKNVLTLNCTAAILPNLPGFLYPFMFFYLRRSILKLVRELKANYPQMPKQLRMEFLPRFKVLHKHISDASENSRLFSRLMRSPAEELEDLIEDLSLSSDKELDDLFTDLADVVRGSCK